MVIKDNTPTNVKFKSVNTNPLLTISDIELNNLLLLAKNDDADSKEKIIKKYYALIVYQSKGIFLSTYTYDDLVQVGVVFLLRAITNFDLNKGVRSFTSYVFWCLKNNFNYLCRQEIRYNQFYSLNTVLEDGVEPIDLIADEEILEEIVLKKITSNNLKASFNVLNYEELELINFLYFNCSIDQKPHLSKYAKIKGKDYYYCTMLKKRTLAKLQSPLRNI